MGYKPKILIVDDKIENIFSLKQILSSVNIEIIEAQNGNDALVESLNHDFAAAILDVQMPGMNGYELAKFLRSDQKTKRLPIIFVSAVYSSDFHVFKGYDSGAVDFLVKPFDAKILISKLNIFLEIDHQRYLLKESKKKIENQLYQLKSSENRFSSLVNTIPDIVYRIDPEGCFTYINEAIKKLGYKREELIGRHFSSLIWPVDLKKISRKSVIKHTVKSSKSITRDIKLFDERRTGKRKTTGLEIHLLTKKNSMERTGIVKDISKKTVIAEVNSAGFYSDNIQKSNKIFLGTVGVIRDITERKKLEDNLRKANDELEAKVLKRTSELVEKNKYLIEEIEKRKKAEERSRKAEKEWKDIFEAIGHMTMILDSNYTIIEANKAVFQILEQGEESVIGKKCYEIFHQSDSPYPGCPMETCLEKKVTSEKEIQFNEKSFIISTTPILDNNHECQKIIHIATDITKIKQLEKELIQAHKIEAIGTLAGGIAHDFNNILASLLGFAELSMTSVEKGSTVERDLKEIYKAGLRAKELVMQILTFARQSEDELMPVRVDLIIKEVLKFIRATIPSSIEIKHNIKSKEKVLSNATQMHQILMNMCSNAAHAMKKNGGVLKITLEDVKISTSQSERIKKLKAGRYLKLEISDTGVGIPENIISQIFEPYFTTKEIGEGTGMGLAVVDSIIKNAGGSIEVASRIGKGTVFTIFLPITLEEIKKAEPDADLVTEDLDKTILFVDDEKLIIKVAKNILEKTGYTVFVYDDPVKALSEFEKAPDKFDIVVSDLTMPHMTGDRLISKIKKMRSDIPAVLCSGYMGKTLKSKIDTKNIDAFIDKPFRSDKFISIIQREIHKYKKKS